MKNVAGILSYLTVLYHMRLLFNCAVSYAVVI
jgi:hypothetical protein